MAFSVGIGLTNECNLRCAHCYRPDMAHEQLTRADVSRVCDAVTASSMNLGVGENGLHPEYLGILDDLAARAIKTSITSNGLSIHALDDAHLTRFHSVELSLDFPTEAEHDGFRGPGNWRTVVAALERCASLAVPVTITAVMMTINYRRLPALARVAAGFGANLRVNVYQPSRTDRFTLGYDQLWDGFRGLAAATRLVVTTEPVLAGVLGISTFRGSGCGRSTVRVAPDGAVMPCTYWPGSRLTIADLERVGDHITEAQEFLAARRVPDACAECPCRGGCAGRRALTGQVGAPDPYCPFARNDRIALDWEATATQDLPKIGSACTTVVSAR